MKTLTATAGSASALAAILCMLFLMPFPVVASALLLFDNSSQSSFTDCVGVSQALAEAGIVHEALDMSNGGLNAGHLAGHAVVVACHLENDSAQAELLGDWVAIGGGLLATGRSGFGMEGVLGLDSLGVISGDSYSEVEFVTDHPVTTGTWWDGTILSAPPMPVNQVPSVMRHYYWNPIWPSYVAVPMGAAVVARWRDGDWETDAGLPAITVHEFEQGRAVYSGALPGAYSDWDWPRSWRIMIVTTVGWLSNRQPLVELGYWPDAHRGAFAWSGDTEMPAMQTAVPALLDLFADLGLERFGTFYVVGQSGGDAGTVGAAEFPEVVEAIAMAGSEVGGHGDVHTSFKDQSLADQRLRLEQMLEIIEPLLAPHGEQVSGFRAPYLEQDGTTWQALAELGFDHDAGEADVWSATTLPHPTGGMLQLPSTMPMDWHLFEEHGIEPAVAETIWLDKLDYVLSRRGLFSWLHHPWVIEDHLEWVENVLTVAVERGDLWMARQDDIAAWWRQRENVLLYAETGLGGRIEVMMLNEDAEALTGVSVWIRVPDGDEKAWTARLDGQTVALLERDHAGSLYRIAVVPELLPDEIARLVVTTEDPIFADWFEPE